MTEPEAGSDAGATRTTATLRDDSWVVNGSKAFITNAGTEITQCVTITALTGEGEVSNIVIENGTPGYEISGPLHKIGWKASDTRALSFTDCAVPEHNLLGARGQGFHQFLEILDGGRISVAAMGVGVAQGAYDLAYAYARERQQFGRPISSFQAIQFKLADMATEIEAARGLVWKAAWLKDQGRAVRARSGDGKAVHRRALESRRQRVAPDPRRLRLHRRVPHLAAVSRSEDPRDRRGDERSTADGDRPAPGPAVRRAVVAVLAPAIALAACGAAAGHVTISPPFVEDGVEDRDRVRRPRTSVLPTRRSPSASRHHPESRSSPLPPPRVGHRPSTGRSVAWTGGRLEDRATASFPVRILARVRAGTSVFTSVQTYDDGAVVRWQANLSVLPATGRAAPKQHPWGAIGAALVGLVVIAGSLVGVRLLRRRPLQER